MPRQKQQSNVVPVVWRLVMTPRMAAVSGALLLGVMAFVAYLPSMQSKYLLDDDLYLTDSPLVKSFDGLRLFWFSIQPLDYYPITNTSFWIEWRLWGMNPIGYHVTNLLLHFASALLVWMVLNKLGNPGAYLAALLFAVHPSNVESVAWISQRKDLLAVVFCLVSVLWYLKFLSVPEIDSSSQAQTSEPSPNEKWYWASLLAFLLAMLSKGSVAFLPIVLPALTWWQRRKVNRTDWLRTAPFFLIAIGLSLVNVWWQHRGFTEPIRTANALERLQGAGAALWFYLAKALAPIDLVFIYPEWRVQAFDILWWLPVLAAALVTAVLLWQRETKWGLPLLAAWGFFGVALAPMLGFTDVGFMQHSLVANHYEHLALIAVVALAAAGINQFQREPSTMPWATSIVVVVIGTLTILTWQQNCLFETPMTLYQETLAKNPNTWLAHFYLGFELFEAGRFDEAIEHYRRALDLHANFSEAHNALGSALVRRNHVEEGIEHFKMALRLQPEYSQALSNLGIALDALGKDQEANAQLTEAIRLNPNWAEAHLNLANHLAKAGRPKEAVEEFRRALELQPGYSDAHTDLALALASQGQWEEAIEQYRQAVQENPDSVRAQNNLGNALARLGRFEEAITHLEAAVRLQPDSAKIQNNLGATLADLGRFEEAIGHYQTAIQLDPGYAQAYFNLAKASAKLDRSAEAIAAAERGLAIARKAERTALVQQIESWLKNYQASLPNSNKTAPPKLTPSAP